MLTIKARVQSLRKEAVSSPIFSISTDVKQACKDPKKCPATRKTGCDSIKSQFFGLLSHFSNLGITTFRDFARVLEIDCVFAFESLS